ncbi:MAG: MFS transporter [Cohaesibacteraceae bacterium]|nr:MFS transporter [Cohaesibacteraceae bacterium]
MQTLSRLTTATWAMHIADQIAISSVPLIAALSFNATPQIIGALVACQALAHLIVSIPAGQIVDRVAGRTVATMAALIAFAGFAGATFSLASSAIIFFAISVTIAGIGIVLYVLATLSIIPTLVEKKNLAKANAGMETGRALAMFSMPLGVGLLASTGYVHVALPLACLASVLAVIVSSRLPKCEAQPGNKPGIMQSIRNGGSFVIRQSLLRPIALCAIFWNLAFAALIAILAPLLLNTFNADPAIFGIALSIQGIGMFVGATLMRRYGDRIAPNHVLVFGLGISVLAIFILVATPASGPIELVYLTFFLLGIGPMMWLVTQNSIRQLITPGHMLGSVNAVIQTAIYGVRPLGALAGGFTAGNTSPQTALLYVAGAFVLSFLVSAFSALRTVKTYETKPTEAAKA